MKGIPLTKGKAVVRSEKLRLLVIEMFARGYTVRRIRTRLKEETGTVPSETELLRLAHYFAEDIDQAREDLAAMVMQRGLAMKEERVMRLTELAEEWENRAKESSKAAGIYMRAIKQIQDEMEPLGISLIIPQTDPWGQLLMQVRNSALEGTSSPQLPTGMRQTDQKAGMSSTDPNESKST